MRRSHGGGGGANGGAPSANALAQWQDVCSILVRTEKRRKRGIQELEGLKQQQSTLLEMTAGEIARQIPAVKRQLTECVQSLNQHSTLIMSAQTKLAYLISLMESEERLIASAPTVVSNGLSAAFAVAGTVAPSMLTVGPTTTSTAPPSAATTTSAYDGVDAAVDGTANKRTPLDEYMSTNFPVVKGKGPLPILCGATPPGNDYVCPEGALAAVWRKETWIVCQVIKSIRERGGGIKYEMEDVDCEPDPEGLPKRFVVPARHVIPLPTTVPDAYRPKPPEAEYPTGSAVLALYPTTTCLYQGRVLEPPSKRKASNNYLIEFAGDPPEQLEIPQQVVVPYRKKYAKTGKDA